jgi:hypothetical protein
VSSPGERTNMRPRICEAISSKFRAMPAETKIHASLHLRSYRVGAHENGRALRRLDQAEENRAAELRFHCSTKRTSLTGS